MGKWLKCDECANQITEWDVHPIDPHHYPVDDYLQVCTECYENFYLYYDQTRRD